MLYSYGITHTYETHFEVSQFRILKLVSKSVFYIEQYTYIYIYIIYVYMSIYVVSVLWVQSVSKRLRCIDMLFALVFLIRIPMHATELTPQAGYVHIVMKKVRFVEWFIGDVLVNALVANGDNPGLTPQHVAMFRGTFSSPLLAWKKFSNLGEDKDGVDVKGCENMTQDNFNTFLGDMVEGSAAAHAARILYGTFVGSYEESFQHLASDPDQGFATYLDPNFDGNHGALHEAYAAFHKALTDQPVAIEASADGAMGYAAEPGDDDSEAREQLYKQVLAMRKKLVTIHSIGDWRVSKECWKPGGKASAVFQRSKVASFRGEPGTSNAIILLSADLFPTRAHFGGATPHKDSPVWDESMKEALQWMSSARANNTVLIAFDGRCKKMKRAIEDWTETSVDQSRYIDGWVVYAGEGRADIRRAQRKVYHASNNRETYGGCLPVAKVRVKTQERAHYSACGEQSTHDSTYTAVALRSLAELPRMSLSDKEKMTGCTLPAYPENVNAETISKGHPLFWLETKSVDFFMALYRDFRVDCVFDLTSGSGAAACAAAACGATYDGLAMNESHATWITNIMDKVIFSIMSTSAEHKDLAPGITRYFANLVEQGRIYLRCSDGPDAEEENGGEDDSNAEDK